MTERIYYWEHDGDASRFLRSKNPREIAAVAHRAGGEVGVIIDDGGPLRVVAVALEETVQETAGAMSAVE